MPKTDIGWIARVLGGVQNWWGNRKTRIKDGLISTGDSLMPLLKSKKKRKDMTHKEKQIDHYRRQWLANRKKLK